MKKPDILPNFAVFEGGDGSGTTTQLGLLKKRFETAAGTGALPVFFPTFEPTRGPIGKLIREALKGDLPLKGETIARLFTADRNEHLYGADGMAERARRGELVVSDRYVLSSLVYQGLECGDDIPRLLNASFPLPELVIFFDIDGEAAFKRLDSRTLLEIYEYPEFQRNVRDRYRALLPRWRADGVRVETVDASLPPETIAEEVWRALSKMPIMRGRS
jgi:dTMP kinase